MLKVIKPTLEDLWFKQKMMADEDTMSFNHDWDGTIPFPKEKWQNWYNHWIVKQENQRYYKYLQDECGNFVGEIAYYYNAEYDKFIANVIIFSKFRRKGYGSQGLVLLCDAAKKNGVAELYDDIAIDNTAAINLFLKHGFSEDYRTDKILMLWKKL